jgi:hypothetical protein
MLIKMLSNNVGENFVRTYCWKPIFRFIIRASRFSGIWGQRNYGIQENNYIIVPEL